jgi:photosynthetic reaction center cytochrome c subunit
MRLRTATSMLAGCLILGLAVTVTADGDQRGGGQARPTQNLQVLPSTYTTADMMPIMRNVARALGVQCTHCHVQNRAADEKPQKLIARKMFEMVMHINNEHLAGIGEPAPPGQPKVTCFTCHRGSLKPATAPDGGI